MSNYLPIDDYGTELHPAADMSVESMLAYMRWQYEGVAEAIGNGHLSGESDDESLRYFGLIL
jgi:hypothetical protein